MLKFILYEPYRGRFWIDHATYKNWPPVKVFAIREIEKSSLDLVKRTGDGSGIAPGILLDPPRLPLHFKKNVCRSSFNRKESISC
jgi:hypothetical protein